MEKRADSISKEKSLDRLLDILVKPFNLRFPDEDELAFREEQNRETNKNLRYVLAGIFFCILGYVLSGEGTGPQLVLRFGLPAILMTAGMTYLSPHGRHVQLLTALFSTTTLLVIFGMIINKTIVLEKSTIYILIVSCIFGHFLVTRLFFIPALISSLAVFAGLIIMNLAVQNPDMPKILYITLICSVLGIVICQRLEVLRRENFISLRNIKKEKTKTRKLVERIIPHPLVDRILNFQQGAVPDVCDDVEFCSVLFVELSGNLDEPASRNLFRIFDSIVGRSGMEKIKTYEHCYIAAGGLFGAQFNCEETLNVAIRFRQEVIQHNIDHKKQILFRAAIATGAASTGIIGERVFAFDLWGKPVNLASRIMNAAPWGTICISKESLRNLPEGYLTASLGNFDLKGVGSEEIFEFQNLNFGTRFSGRGAA